MLVFAKGAGVKAQFAQAFSEVGGKSVERVNFFRVYPFDHFDQVWEIGMITERKSGVGSVTKAATGIDRPTGQDCDANFAELSQHGRTGDIRRAEQDSAVGESGLIRFVFGKALAELLVDFGELENRPVKHDGKTGIAEAAEQFLAFAERVAEENGSFIVIERLFAKADDAGDYFLGWRKAILRPAIGAFHDQNIGVARFARFGRQAAAEFEVAGVEHRFTNGDDQGHRAAEDVSCREQSE